MNPGTAETQRRERYARGIYDVCSCFRPPSGKIDHGGKGLWAGGAVPIDLLQAELHDLDHLIWIPADGLPGAASFLKIHLGDQDAGGAVLNRLQERLL